MKENKVLPLIIILLFVLTILGSLTLYLTNIFNEHTTYKEICKEKGFIGVEQISDKIFVCYNEGNSYKLTESGDIKLYFDSREPIKERINKTVFYK